ncbi:hypothetical protein [Geitlerinema sp. PCC 9228]|jgi:hypothetical protein|uniref:hypothetical protein n=1 Tax=Geitlerinema sp. PCC 9228 TaxID=111611 RepID=UPI0008F9A192|nr:hypothetical protein [Geitlerinema sp. PCC 9228]
MKRWLQVQYLLLAIALGTSAATITNIASFPTNFATANSEEEPTGSPPPGSGVSRDFRQLS